MARRLISSGSAFEEQIGYSRAVVDGEWVFVSGTTGFDYATMTISADVVAQADQCFKNIVAALAEAAGARRVTLGRELTKQFETVVTLPAAEVPAWLAADANRLRGEFVLVLHALPRAAAAEGDLPVAAEHCLSVLLRELPLKQAVALAADISGAPRNALYQRALRLRDEGG